MININNHKKPGVRKWGVVALAMMGVLVTLYHTFASSNSGTPRFCYPKSVVFPDYIQVNETRFVTGERRLSAWRIYPDNSLDMARWNGNGELQASMEHMSGAQGLYAQVTDLQISPKEKAATDSALGRSAYSVIVSKSKKGRTSSIQATRPSSDLVAIIEQLNNSIGTVYKPDPGHYLWVQPTNKPADILVNLNSKGACTDKRMIQSSNAIVSCKLLTRIDDLFKNSANEKIQLGAAVSLKAGPGWYVVGRIKTAD